MKKYTNQIEKEEIIYELTQDELCDLLKNSFNKSKKYIGDYILFCYNHYIYKLNISGLIDLLSDIISFVCGNSNYIRNTYKLDYFDFLNKYDYKCPYKDIQL